MFSYLIKRKINKQLKINSETRKKRFWDYREVKSITFLVEQAQLDGLRPFMRSLLEEGMLVYLVVLNTSKGSIDWKYPATSVLELTSQQLILWKSLPNKEAKTDFLELPPSILCDLTVKEYLPLMYLISISMSEMKLGIEKSSLPLFDFSLAPVQPDSSLELAENLFFYWKSIDIKDNNS